MISRIFSLMLGSIRQRLGQRRQRPCLEDGHRLLGGGQKLGHKRLSALRHQLGTDSLLFIENRKVIDRKGIAAKDARKRIQAAHGALGDGNVRATDQIEDLAGGADRRLDVAVRRSDHDRQDLDVLHGQQQRERQVIIDATIVNEQHLSPRRRAVRQRHRGTISQPKGASPLSAKPYPLHAQTHVSPGAPLPCETFLSCRRRPEKKLSGRPQAPYLNCGIHSGLGLAALFGLLFLFAFGLLDGGIGELVFDGREHALQIELEVGR
jgi:hypothetical protein